jgi:hypothetical protein
MAISGQLSALSKNHPSPRGAVENVTQWSQRVFRGMRMNMKRKPVDLKAFAQYIQDKSITQLLHHARKESLKRILAHEDLSPTPRKKPAQKRTGTR